MFGARFQELAIIPTSNASVVMPDTDRVSGNFGGWVGTPDALAFLRSGHGDCSARGERTVPPARARVATPNGAAACHSRAWSVTQPWTRATPVSTWTARG
ncbi:MAG: hypothetical protein HND58_06835 [Planctomycetota bacterium]|nr:MAG: hypothetical protein HND58_06835 [Planctomycetota bacterium]